MIMHLFVRCDHAYAYAYFLIIACLLSSLLDWMVALLALPPAYLRDCLLVACLLGCDDVYD